MSVLFGVGDVVELVSPDRGALVRVTVIEADRGRVHVARLHRTGSALYVKYREIVRRVYLDGARPLDYADFRRSVRLDQWAYVKMNTMYDRGVYINGRDHDHADADAPREFVSLWMAQCIVEHLGGEVFYCPTEPYTRYIADRERAAMARVYQDFQKGKK